MYLMELESTYLKHMSARILFLPGQVPASRIVKSRIPRNPLLGNTFQELLSEAGAVECLSANIAPPKSMEVPKEDEEVDEPMDEVPDNAEDTRTKAQDILDKLRSWNADPDVIKQQQRVVDAFAVLAVARTHYAEYACIIVNI